MSSHKVIHGRLANRNISHQDAIDMLHDMSHSQKSFFRECALQHLGQPPSAYWGRQPVPVSFPNIDKKTMVHIARALGHPHHVTSQLILENKKAAAGWASMASKVAEGAEKVGEYGLKAAKFVGNHIGTIKKIADAVHTGVSIGRGMGIIDNDSALSEADDLYAELTGQGFYRSHIAKKRYR